MMAESVVVEGKTVEELQREITCGICQEHYTEPKILPCLHYYCKQCVLRLALKAGTGRPFSCPECRSQATLPEGGVDELKTAFFVNRLKTTVTTIEQPIDMVYVKCELCIDPGVKPEAYCRQCSMLICNECIKQHKRIKPFLTHEVTSLEDFKVGKTKPVVVKEPQALTKCADHGETIILYCFDCDMLICHCCVVKGHSDHKFEFCAKAAPTIKQELLETLKPLKEQVTFLSWKLAEVQIVKQEIDAKGNAIANYIRTSFNELQDMLAKSEREMLDKTAGMVYKKKDRLSKQQATLSYASAVVQSVVDYIEQCVRYSTDNEVMSMYTEVKRQIEQLTGHCKSKEVVQYNEEGEAKCFESVRQVSQPQANPQWPIIADMNAVTANYTAHLKITSKPEVGSVINAIVTLTSTANKELVISVCNVTCLLKNVRRGNIVQGSTERKKPGIYSVQCTPTARGRHELAVSMNGRHVNGSPFPVFVCCPPSQLTKATKTWSNVPLCLIGMAVTSTGEIFITTNQRSIIKIDAAGERQTVMKQNKYQFSNVLVSDRGTIYCLVDTSGSITILEYDTNGRHILTKTSHPITLNLKVVGDEYVCKIASEFQVFNKDLECVRPIKHDGRGTFVAAAGDNEGNMYFVDSSNNCIQVYDNEGVYLRCFDTDQGGRMRLRTPQDVYVVGHYVYVVNRYDVAVFTTEGGYVTSLDLGFTRTNMPSNGKSMCDYLKYIDMDGYVYIYCSNYVSPLCCY